MGDTVISLENVAVIVTTSEFLTSVVDGTEVSTKEIGATRVKLSKPEYTLPCKSVAETVANVVVTFCDGVNSYIHFLAVNELIAA